MGNKFRTRKKSKKVSEKIIFPEKIREIGSRGHFQKKKFPKIFGNIYILNNINR
jgi:hypothetical protein